MTRAGLKRANTRRLLLALALAALCLLAQSSRDAYRNAYRTWREADPSLELDAATAPGEALAARAANSATLAASYGAAHTAALKSAAEEQAQNLQWLGATTLRPLPDLASAPEEMRFATRESAGVSATIAAFANDPDPAIQQLRQALQREQAAADALKTSVVDRQQIEDKAFKAVSSAEEARARTMQQFALLSSALTQSADAMNRETADWAAYYSKLQDAARALSSSGPATAALSDAAPPAPASASASPRAPSVSPVPLARYVGDWSYHSGSPFFGNQPETVDVTVHEDNGHVTGTFSARFKLPPGAAGDPVLHFEFSGDIKPTLKQTFTLSTAEGAAGTIDLNPGVAFNELEINFTTDVMPGKIHQGDALLQKQ